jgi:4-hydroxybenzoate polyprenyltransferase
VLLAGGSAVTALRLGGAMVGLQASIGALNDLRDAAADSVSKPSKPLPSGRATPAAAWAVTLVGLVAGLGLSIPSGLPTLILAVAGVACGYVYDVWLKQTAWSWLPLALALPLLPAYAWVGAGFGLPPGWFVLFPAAILAGAALAISNALADAEADRKAGLGTVVASLGFGRAWWLHAALLCAVAALAVATLSWVGAGGRGLLSAVLMAVGTIAIGAGALLLRASRPETAAPSAGLGRTAAQSGGPGRLDPPGVAWGLEALGVVALAFGWLAGVASAGS